MAEFAKTQAASEGEPHHHDRDDSPFAFSLARRQILVGGSFLVGGLAALSALPAMSATASWSDETAARFLELSSLLIPHRLNEEIGKRMGAAMSAFKPVAF